MKKRILAVIEDFSDVEKNKNEFDTSCDEYSDEVKLFASRPEALILKIARCDLDDKQALKKKILDLSPSCVFNRFEGVGDSITEIEFAHLLEETGIPFTGNSSYTLGLCLNKWETKNLLRQSGVLVPPGIFINNIRKIDTRSLSFPLFLKPCWEDGSIGIDEASLVLDEMALVNATSIKLKQFPKGLVAEEFIPGKEYSIGMIGNATYDVLGVSVLDYTANNGQWSFLTYNSKWISNTPEYEELIASVDEWIPEFILEKLTDVATKTAKVLQCRGYFRIDMRERNGEIFVLDVNPNPNISEDSSFMRMALKKGYTYETMIECIIALAVTDKNVG